MDGERIVELLETILAAIESRNADLKEAITEGNASLKEAITEGNASLKTAITDGFGTVLKRFDALNAKRGASFARRYKHIISHSEVTIPDEDLIQKKLNLKGGPVSIDVDTPQGIVKTLTPFPWTYQEENHQKVEYTEYIRSLLQDELAKFHLQVEPIDHHLHALVATVGDLMLTGTADLLIKPSYSPSGETSDAYIVIEVKKPGLAAHRNSRNQAISELLALDIHTKHPVYSVLTDFQQYWQFFWLGRNRVIYTTTFHSLGAGVYALKQILASQRNGFLTKDALMLNVPDPDSVCATKLKYPALRDAMADRYANFTCSISEPDAHCAGMPLCSSVSSGQIAKPTGLFAGLNLYFATPLWCCFQLKRSLTKSIRM